MTENWLHRRRIGDRRRTRRSTGGRRQTDRIRFLVDGKWLNVDCIDITDGTVSRLAEEFIQWSRAHPAALPSAAWSEAAG